MSGIPCNLCLLHSAHHSISASMLSSQKLRPPDATQQLANHLNVEGMGQCCNHIVHTCIADHEHSWTLELGLQMQLAIGMDKGTQFAVHVRKRDEAAVTHLPKHQSVC